MTLNGVMAIALRYVTVVDLVKSGHVCFIDYSASSSVLYVTRRTYTPRRASI